MAEVEGAVATEISEDSWVHDHDYLDDDSKQTLSKYKTQEEAIKATVHSTKKFAEYDEKIKNSVNWPDDKTSDEDRAAFDAKVHTHQGVPKTKEEYEFDRSTIPEGTNYDEDMESGFRQWAIDNHVPKTAATALHSLYTKMMLGRHEAMDKLAKEGEQTLRDDEDFDFDVKIGKEGGDIGTIKTRLLELSKLLKMDYKGEDDSAESHLADDLEFIGPKGAIGDKIHFIKALDYLLEYRFAEGQTHLGEPAGKGKEGKGGEFGTKGFYEVTDQGEQA